MVERTPTEEEIREVLVENGPLYTLGLISRLARERGRTSLNHTIRILEGGNFYQDDSGRWHLGTED